jgi:small GTP-binding protein
MGNFISSNAVQAKSEPSQLLMIGLDWAGKTTILYKIKKPWEKVITSIPTIGFDIKTTKTHGTVFMAWDAGGRAMICPLVKKYYDRVEGIIFVIDSSDMRRFEYHEDIFFQTINNDRLYGKPLLVLCNKQDLAGAVSPNKICAQLGLVEKCKDRKWNVVGCSATARGDIRLKKGLEWLSESLQDVQNDSRNVTFPSEQSIVTAETEIDMNFEPTNQEPN